MGKCTTATLTWPRLAPRRSDWQNKSFIRQYERLDSALPLPTIGRRIRSYTRYDALGNCVVVTDANGGATTYGYDGLNRLLSIQYPDSAVQYAYDAAGNRTVVTSVTPTPALAKRTAGASVSGTVVTTHAYDAANRLTARARSDGWSYTYNWSPCGQMLAEWTRGLPARAFTYDGAGRMVEARVLTLTTRFRYTLALQSAMALGARLVVTEGNVVGRGAQPQPQPQPQPGVRWSVRLEYRPDRVHRDTNPQIDIFHRSFRLVIFCNGQQELAHSRIWPERIVA
ncbi:MAG: RHS repeat protein [Thermoflexales bacterium]|nr:RHS repeat protein [Thermoflexales bacterium]